MNQFQLQTERGLIGKILNSYEDCDYLADLQDLSKESILILLRLNLRHRVIDFNQFGIEINYSKFI